MDRDKVIIHPLVNNIFYEKFVHTLEYKYMFFLNKKGNVKGVCVPN